ncbi:MAG: hypothetical protein LBB11_02725, partial [Puniceicoccales bacterium]|nr:hypothetical protein [Puniceicoccales bacterium]
MNASRNILPSKMMHLSDYMQKIGAMIDEDRLPHAIIVEAKNAVDAQNYVHYCANRILKVAEALNHPDFFSISPTGKSNTIKIESVRELIDVIQKTPHEGHKKVAAIFNAHRLHSNAAEAMLKILEEPPEDTVLLLTTPSKTLLLATIISRCALHHLSGNAEVALPLDFQAWLDQWVLFLKKLQADPTNVHPLELFDLVTELSQREEALEEEHGRNHGENRFIGDIDQRLLQEITESVWNVFRCQLPPYRLEQLMKIITEASYILIYNGRFSHVVESVLLQLYRELHP